MEPLTPLVPPPWLSGSPPPSVPKQGATPAPSLTPLVTPPWLKKPDDEESRFQKWYAERAKALDLDPNPDDPRHHYDYRAAFKAGAEPGPDGHWPSQFKASDHPNRFVDGVDTIAGELADPLARKKAQMAEAAEIAKAQAAGMEPDREPFIRHDDPAMRALTAGLPLPPAVTEGIGDAVESLARGATNTAGAFGALAEREGRQLLLPPEDPKMTPQQAAALERLRSLQAVGAPGAALPMLASAGEQPYRETIQEPIAEPLVETGVAVQERTGEAAQAFPRPEYAEDFWAGMKTDPVKTLAVVGAENLPNLLVTMGASAVNPALGVTAAWAQETGAAYQEAKQQGASEEEAQQISGWVGATNMFLEYLPAGRALRALKGGANKEIAKGAMRTLLEQAAAEGGTESVQELNGILAQALGSAKAQNLSVEEVLKRVAEAGIAGLLLGAGGGAGAAVQPQIASAESEQLNAGDLGGAPKSVDLAGNLTASEVSASEQPAMGPERFAGLNAALAEERGRRPTPAPKPRDVTGREAVPITIEGGTQAEQERILGLWDYASRRYPRLAAKIPNIFVMNPGMGASINVLSGEMSISADSDLGAIMHEFAHVAQRLKPTRFLKEEPAERFEAAYNREPQPPPRKAGSRDVLIPDPEDEVEEGGPQPASAPKRSVASPAGAIAARPLPLPVLAGVNPRQIEDAWAVLSMRYPRLTSSIERVEAMPKGRAFSRSAEISDDGKVLRIPAGETVTPETLVHELTHVAQAQRRKEMTEAPAEQAAAGYADIGAIGVRPKDYSLYTDEGLLEEARGIRLSFRENKKDITAMAEARALRAEVNRRLSANPRLWPWGDEIDATLNYPDREAPLPEWASADPRTDASTRQRIDALADAEERRRAIDAARYERLAGRQMSPEEAGARRQVIRSTTGRQTKEPPSGPGPVPQPPAEVQSGDPWVVEPARAAELRASGYQKPLAVLEGGQYRIETAEPKELPDAQEPAQAEAPEPPKARQHGVLTGPGGTAALAPLVPPPFDVPRETSEAPLEDRAIALARRLGRRPKVPEIQREMGVPYVQARELWQATKGWESQALALTQRGNDLDQGAPVLVGVQDGGDGIVALSFDASGPEISRAQIQAMFPDIRISVEGGKGANVMRPDIHRFRVTAWDQRDRISPRLATEIATRLGGQVIPVRKDMPQWLRRKTVAARAEEPRAELPQEPGRASAAESEHPIASGSRDSAVTERGNEIEFDYAVVDARDLVTSNDDALRPNPAYPQDVQPRDRTRATSEAQVSNIQKKLNPELLAASPRVSDGAPIIGEDRVVESGNARSIGIRRAYKEDGEPAQRYRGWVRENADRFGLDAEALAGLEQPVLVRVRRTPVDRAEFAREANEGTLAVMSATERAASDAARVTPEMLDSIHIPESGEVNWAANRDFVRAFAREVASPNEQGSMFDDRGQLSTEGERRIQNAVLARAYGDPDAVAKLAEHADNNVRNVGNALLREAPRFARLWEGERPGLDLSKDIGAALRKLSGLRAEGAKVQDYLAQGELLGAEMTTEARELLRIFDANARSSAKISDVLRRYADLVEGLGSTAQSGLFGAKKEPTKLEMIREAEEPPQGRLLQMRPLARAGEAGAVVMPSPTSGPLRRWLRRYFTKEGSLPAALYEAKVSRDFRVAARLNRIDALARDLNWKMRRYKGPLSRGQLARYLDNAFRGMNLRTGGEAMDEKQIARIAKRRGLTVEQVRKEVERTVPETEAGLREAPQFIPIIREIRQHVDGLTRSLRRAGLLDDAVARELERHFGLYVHRQYEATRNPRWAERVKKQPLWRRAFELTKAKFPNKPDSEIWGMLASYVDRAGGPGRVILPGGTPEGAKDLQILRKRTDQDDFRRLLLGETREAGSNFFTTAARMATLLEQQRFLDEFSRAGKKLGVLTDRPDITAQGEETKKQIDPGMYAKAIEKATGADPKIGDPPGLDRLVVKRSQERTKATETGKKSDPLGGLYTTDDINQELQRLFEHESYPAWLQWYMRANYVTKANKTAASIQATARNFLSNFLYVVAQGVNPANPKAFAQAARLSYPRVFGSTGREMLAEIEELQELGLFDQGTDLGDLKRQEKEAQMFRGDFPGAGRAGVRGLRFLGEFYQAPDNFSKAYVFKQLLPDYKKAYPKLSEKEVKRKLAGILRDTMQNYSAVPRGVQALSARFPLIAPFLSFGEEIVRNTKNTAIIGAREIKEGKETGNKELAKLGARKLTGLAAAYSIPTVTATIAHWLLNTDDEEEEAARRFMPPWSKNGTIIVRAREDGSIDVVDLSFMDTFAQIKDPILTALRGEPEEALKELLTPIGEEILAGALMDVRANKKPTGGEIYNPQDTWLARQVDKGQYLWKVTGPGTTLTAGKIYDAIQSKEMPEGQRRVLWQEIVALGGPRISNYKLDNALGFKARQFKRDIRDARDLEVDPARRKKMSGEDLKRPEEKVIRRIQEIIQELADDIAAAEKLGLNMKTIKAGLRDGDMARWEVDYLERGDFDGMVKRYLGLNQKQIDEAQKQYAVGVK